jgi:DNA-directed RNA polymerase subunit RPC12/RpoP
MNNLRRKELICPNASCGKPFEKPVMLMDGFSLPRQTYYACPHCKSKLEIVVESGKFMKIVSVRNAGGRLTKPSNNKTPKNCPHYFGFLRSLSDPAPIPDECLICPKIIQCFVHQK